MVRILCNYFGLINEILVNYPAEISLAVIFKCQNRLL